MVPNISESSVEAGARERANCGRACRVSISRSPYHIEPILIARCFVSGLLCIVEERGSMKSFLRYVICLFLAASSPIMFAQTVVRVAPPAPVRVGVVGRPPHPGYVWTEGYQRWNGTRYVWVSGRWMRPPRPGVVWVSPLWVRRGNGWVFRAGYWR